MIFFSFQEFVSYTRIFDHAEGMTGCVIELANQLKGVWVPAREKYLIALLLLFHTYKGMAGQMKSGQMVSLYHDHYSRIIEDSFPETLSRTNQTKILR